MATIIEMPKLSDTMSVGTLVKWYKNIGDPIRNGDILAEVETDKATMELENFDDGTLINIFVGEGEEVPVGSPLAAVGEPGEKIDPPSTETKTETDITENVLEPEIKEENSPVQVTTPNIEPSNVQTEKLDPKQKDSPKRRVLISPLAKKIALERNIDFKNLNGSGPNGRIIKNDILAVSNTGPKNSSNLSDNSQIPLNKSHYLGNLQEKSIQVSKIRNIIASRLLESKTTIPHFYLQKEINSLPLKEARFALNLKLSERSNDEPTKLTLNDLVLKACAETIKDVPEINTSWEGSEIKYHGSVHLAFGVAIDDGLVTPVVKNAHSMDLESLSKTAKSLINKARSKKLSPDEMTGSTFTVTNLGMFGIDFFSGIINPPNAAILSIGASVKKPVIDTNGQITAGETMMLGLSCDHRLVDGAIGAVFLQKLAVALENPATIFI